jgi:hypothetical protein
MTDQPQKRKRGGQPKPAAERKRNNMTFRVRDSLRAELQASADKHQRSVSEEIEYRLEHSFQAERILGGLQEFGRKAERAARIQEGVEAPPVQFMSPDEAAKPFQPAPIMPPALKEAFKEAIDEAAARVAERVEKLLTEAGLVHRKGAA